MSNRTRTGDIRDHNPTPANPLLDVKAYKIGVKRPCYQSPSIAFHCSILRGFRTVSTKCGRNVVVEWSSNGAISNGRFLHVGLPFGCRARGETETAREVSVRGDKPFERPPRRIVADVAIVRQYGNHGLNPIVPDTLVWLWSPPWRSLKWNATLASGRLQKSSRRSHIGFNPPLMTATSNSTQTVVASFCLSASSRGLIIEGG